MVVTISIFTDILNTYKEVKNRNNRNRLYYLSDWNYQRELANPENYTSLLAAYKSWVYVAASKNATTVASFPLKLYVAKPSKTKTLVATRSITPETKKYLYSIGHLDRYLRKAVEVEEVLEHPFLDLMKNVNPFMNEFELKELTDLHQELTGNAYWYIVDNNAGVPAQVWILYPDKVKIIPDKEKFIKGFLYYNPPNNITFEPSEIVHFKFPSSNDPYHGMGCLSAITHAYNINDNMNRYENALFSNMARPDGILETEQPLNDADFKRITTAWNQKYGKVDKSGKTALLDKGIKYQSISITPRELSFLTGRKVTKEEILNAFGQTLGMYSEESTRANSEMADYTYAKNTTSPRHRRMEQKLNEVLVPRFDERLFCVFENCIPLDKAFEQLNRVANINNGIITRNEARTDIGKEPLDDLDTIYIENSLVPIGTPPMAQGVQQYSADMANEISKRVKEKLAKVK